MLTTDKFSLLRLISKYEATICRLLKPFIPIYRKWSHRRTSTNDRIPLFVITCPRNGSNFLTNSINSHSQIVCHSELFNPKMPIYAKFPGHFRLFFFKTVRDNDTELFLSHIVGKTVDPSIKFVGMKLFPNHLLHSRHRGMLEKWLDKPSVIIHLYRSNKLEACYSHHRALVSSSWTSLSDKGEFNKLSISPEQCRQYFLDSTLSHKYIKKILHDRPHLSVEYEQLCQDPEYVLEQVQRYLGVPVESLQSRYKKQRVQPLNEVLLNYDELANEFCDTHWAQYFEPTQSGR